MAKVTQVQNNDSGITARTAYNEAMKTVETDGTINGDGTTGSPLSAVSSGIPDAPSDGKTYGRKDAAWSEVAIDLTPVEGTGATVLLDNNGGGRIYNAQTPSSSNTITLDFTGAVLGGMAKFVSDGTEVNIVSSFKVNTNGTQPLGERGSIYFYWDGYEVDSSWLPTGGEALELLNPPTFTLVSGATLQTLDYSSVTQDVNATDSVMQISSDQSTWYNVLPSEYTNGDTSGTISEINGVPLVQGTLYYVRITSSATGYFDATTIESATVDTPQLSAPTLVITVQDEALDYDISNVDVNATGGNFEISTDDITYTPVSGWSFGTNTGTISGLTNGTLYYLRLNSTAPNYTDSDWTEVERTPAPFSGLFNEYTDGFVSYGIINNNYNYTGACATIRRSSDETDYELGFDENGVIDYLNPAFVSWLGSDTWGKVCRLYDSSGNGYHLDQTGFAYNSLPIMFSGGSPILDNGLPVIDFTFISTLDSFARGAFAQFNQSNGFTELSVSSSTLDLGSNFGRQEMGDKGSGARIALTRDAGAGKVAAIYSNGAAYVNLLNANQLTGVVLQTLIVNGSIAKVRGNGVDGDNISNLVTVDNSSFKLTSKFNGKMQMYVAFSEDKTTDITGIESKIQERLTLG